MFWDFRESCGSSIILKIQSLNTQSSSFQNFKPSIFQRSQKYSKLISEKLKFPRPKEISRKNLSEFSKKTFKNLRKISKISKNFFKKISKFQEKFPIKP